MYANPENNNIPRLIVILPDALAGNLDLARHLHKMAIRRRCNIIYLTLVDDSGKQLIMTRDMATMASMTSSGILNVSTRIVRISGWLNTLRELYCPGDTLVCFENQTVKTGFLNTAPLNEFLSMTFKAPVQMLSGYYFPARVQLKRWARGLLVWTTFFLIAAVFTGLEINIEHLASGATQTILFAIIVAVEFAAFIGWNNLTNR